jgi:hypothetical protein
MVQVLSPGAFGAHFGGNATVRKSALSVLARSSFDQQLDCLRLAKMGVRRCRDLWVNFERECPIESRLVSEAADIITVENRTAERQVSKVLAKAKRPRLPKSVVKSQVVKSQQAWQPPNAMTSRRTDAQLVETAIRRDFLTTDDPAVRATVERALGPVARARYQQARFRDDPIRARVAGQMGVEMADLVPCPPAYKGAAAPSERERQIRRLLEADLSSPDPAVRQAASGAVSSSSLVTRRQTAMTQLYADDPAVRELAWRVVSGEAG